jgi:quinol-cytochrome oxidoreductase complex cytochrome b subunit
MILTTTNAQGQDTTNSTIYVFIIMMYGFFNIFFILKYTNFFLTHQNYKKILKKINLILFKVKYIFKNILSSQKQISPEKDKD